MGKISKGDILATSRPFVFALLSEERHNRCEQCFQLLSSPANTFTCEDCGYVRYCSEKCRDDSTQSGFHLVECHTTAHRPLRNLTRLIARVLVRLYDPLLSSLTSDKAVQMDTNDSAMVKSVVTSGDGSGCAAEWIRGHKRDWNCLMDHYEDITHDASAMRTFEFIYEELELIFDGSTMAGPATARRLPSLTALVSVETLLRIYGKILVNSFAVQESGPMADGGSSLRQIGRAVYLGPSIFDHSCTPDVMFTFSGTQLYLIALRNLPTDDLRQIYISYIDEFETVEERQRQLRSAFYFDCGCSRCCSDLQGFSLLNIFENAKLRALNEKIEDLYAVSKDESRYAQLAQRKLHLLPSISKISPDFNFSTAADDDGPVVAELKSSIVNLIDAMNLETHLNRLESVQEIRIADFLACHKANPRMLERLSAVYRRFYGEYHPRLLYKLYQFIGVLLEKISTIYHDRKRRLDFDAVANNLIRQLEDAQLQACLHVIGRLFRQTKSIQHFIDDRIAQGASIPIEVVAVLDRKMAGEARKQTAYASRPPSFRDLLQQNPELLTIDKDGSGIANDTRKR